MTCQVSRRTTASAASEQEVLAAEGGGALYDCDGCHERRMDELVVWS
jgi:hypothetical protein